MPIALETSPSKSLQYWTATEKDLEIWQNELSQLEKLMPIISGDIAIYEQKLANTQQQYNSIKRDYYAAIPAGIHQELELKKIIKDCETTLEILETRKSETKAKIWNKSTEINTLIEVLKTRKYTEELDNWMAENFLPAQQKYLEVREEFQKRLAQKHCLANVTTRENLRTLGLFRYFTKIDAGKYQQDWIK